jgi:hypothetical protein
MQLVLANPGCEAVSTYDWLKAESDVLLHHTYDHVLRRKCKHALCVPAQGAQIDHNTALTHKDGNGAEGRGHAWVKQPEVLEGDGQRVYIFITKK